MEVSDSHHATIDGEFILCTGGWCSPPFSESFRFVFRLENHMLLQKGGGIQGAPKPEGWHGILVLGSY